MTLGAWWVAALLCLQPSALAWQDGKLTFPETAPVPSEIAKLLEQKPRAPSKYPLLLEAGGVKVEAERYVDNKNYMGTITVTKDGIQTVIRNPRVDALNPMQSQPAAGIVVFRVGRDGSEPTSAALSPDGLLMYVGSYGGGVRVIDLAQNKEIGLLTDPTLAKYSDVIAHHGQVTRLWTIQDPQRSDHWWVVSAARDATVKVWDAQTKALTAQAGYDAAVESVWLQSGAEVFAAADNIIYRIAPMRPKRIEKFVGSGSPIALLALQDAHLWVKTSENATISWNLETLRQERLYSPIVLAAISADNTRLAIKFGDHQIRVLSSKSGRTVASIQIPRESFKNLVFRRLHLSDDGRYLIMSYGYHGYLTTEVFLDEFITVWDLKSRKIVFENHYFPAGEIKWSKDKRYLLGKTTPPNKSSSIYDFYKKDSIRKTTNTNKNSEIRPKLNDFVFVGTTPDFSEKTIFINLYSAINNSKTYLGAIPDKGTDNLGIISLSFDSSKLMMLFHKKIVVWDAQKSKMLALKARSDPDKYTGGSVTEVLRFSDDNKSVLYWKISRGSTRGYVWNANTLKNEGRADCKKEVLGFLKSPRAVICNDGDALRMIPFTN